MTTRLKRSLILFCFGFLLIAGRADAYYRGYGGWGYYPFYAFGAGSTVQGSILQGMGLYLMGAGQYNLYSAEALAVNTRTSILFNEYVESVNQAMAHRYYSRMAHRKQHHLELAKKHYLQLRDFPTDYDVRHGDALNVKMDLLTAPTLAESVYEKLQVPLSEDFINTIPLQLPSEGIYLSLGELSNELVWPRSLRGKELEPFRSKVLEGLEEAKRSAEDGTVSEDAAVALDQTITDLTSTLVVNNKGGLSHEVTQFLKHVRGYQHALSSSAFAFALNQLHAKGDVTLGTLLKVMHETRMRFGVADSPEQIDAFDRLFHVLQSAPAVLNKKEVQTLAEVMADKE